MSQQLPTSLVASSMAQRRRAFLVGALILVAPLPFDFCYPNGSFLAAWRALWMSVLFVAARLQRPDCPTLARIAVHGATFMCGVAGFVLVAWGGGVTGPRFGLLFALPLVVTSVLPDAPWGAFVLSSMGPALGGVALLWSDGRGALFVGEWVLLFAALTVLAATGALGFRRVWLLGVRAQADRAEALARLADSERKRAQVERLATLGRLAAGVGHEINNPLSFVKANVEWLADTFTASAVKDSHDSELREVFQETRQGIDRITQIVANLRDLVGERPSDIQSVAPGAILDEALRVASPRLAGLNVQREVPLDVPAAQGSERRLMQALVNLLVNAADAAGQAPEPTRRWVRAAVAAQADAVTFTVEDGGPGLSSEVQTHLFEPFVTTKGRRGTGLGLALTREHVINSGGSIEAANVSGAGARFVIRVPRA